MALVLATLNFPQIVPGQTLDDPAAFFRERLTPMKPKEPRNVV